jgi:hypothetical protein
VCIAYSASGLSVSEDMVDSCYFTQMLLEDNIVVSPLSATTEESKTQTGEICAKTKTAGLFLSLRRTF